MLLPSPRLGHVLATLRPYTVLVSVCRVGRSIGIAKSDPYLSAATAVGSATRWSELRRLLSDIPVGAIVVAQPMHGCRAFAYRPLAQSLARINDCRFVAWDARTTLADARREAADNDQWLETGVSEVRRRAAPLQRYPSIRAPSPLRPHTARVAAPDSPAP